MSTLTHMTDNIAAVILAAGKGTRMKSSMPKVMHEIGNMPLIKHVVTSCEKSGADKIITVIGNGMDDVKDTVSPHLTAIQQTQNGTADAVKPAREHLKDHKSPVLIVLGDGPLIQPETLTALINKAQETGIAVLGFEPADPTGYGRFIVEGEHVQDIVEDKDSTHEQKNIRLCNAGHFCVDGSKLFHLLDQIDNNNAQGEYYLTDLVKIARQDGMKCGYITAPENEVMGINTRAQLAQAEKILQQRLRQNAMDNGVTFIDPDTVFLSTDTQFEQDIIIEPHVVIRTGVRIGSGTRINAFSHLEGVTIGQNTSIGPYARVRPKSIIGDNATIGNFIEVNRSEIKPGAKSKHMSYLGDAVIGEKSNIGAGTVIANYDGFNKHQTILGEKVFTGSNSTLVAPVSIGEGAIIGAGSTITKNVSDNELIVQRGRTVTQENGATEYRQRKQKDK